MPTSTQGSSGQSTTKINTEGKTLVLKNPVDKGYLCDHICPCDQSAKLFDKLGRALKQRCTTVGIVIDEERNQLVWRYKAEVGYDMTKTPPAPIMSAKQPNRPSRFPLGAAVQQGILLRDLESGRFQKGILRIPDCIILKATGEELAAMRASGSIDWKQLIPVKANIENVVEIKFEGDFLSRTQRFAYQRIGNLKLLRSTECRCQTRKQRQPQEAPERSPVTTPVPLPVPTARRQDQKPVPAPVPELPRYGPVAPSPNSGRALHVALRAAEVVGGVVLIVGGIWLLVDTLGAGAPVTAEAEGAGVALLLGRTAAAAAAP